MHWSAVFARHSHIIKVNSRAVKRCRRVNMPPAARPRSCVVRYGNADDEFFSTFVRNVVVVSTARLGMKKSPHLTEWWKSDAIDSRTRTRGVNLYLRIQLRP